MVILNFLNKETENINYGFVNKKAFKVLPKELHRKAQIKLARLNAATSMNDLMELKGNRLEKLLGARKNTFSMRINDQYRICFKWINDNALDVEIVDYHS